MIFFFFLQLSCEKKGSNIFNGKTLIGYEPTTTLDTEKPNYKWYYKTELTFKNDSVYIERSPISVYQSDTLYSASDGGFYQYKGTWKEDKEMIEINAVETNCDYCPETVEKTADGSYKKVVRQKNYKGNKTIEGLNLNGITFK